MKKKFYVQQKYIFTKVHGTFLLSYTGCDGILVYLVFTSRFLKYSHYGTDLGTHTDEEQEGWG